MAAEAEAVGKDGSRPEGAGGSGDDVDRDLRIELLESDRRRDEGGSIGEQNTATTSIAPAAPREWPVTPLIEVTGGEASRTAS